MLCSSAPNHLKYTVSSGIYGYELCHRSRDAVHNTKCE